MKKTFFSFALVISIVTLCINTMVGARLTTALWRALAVFGISYVVGLVFALIVTVTIMSSEEPASPVKTLKKPDGQDA